MPASSDTHVNSGVNFQEKVAPIEACCGTGEWQIYGVALNSSRVHDSETEELKRAKAQIWAGFIFGT